MKIYLSHSSNYDYKTKLYEPIKQAFAQNHDIYLPHDAQNDGANSRETIENSDIVLAEVSYQST